MGQGAFKKQLIASFSASDDNLWGWKVSSRNFAKTSDFCWSDLHHAPFSPFIGTFLLMGRFMFFVAFHME
jgi:hypothetical protein